MPEIALPMLLDDVRAKLLRRLEGVSDAQARWAPPGLHNSMLWHAGHALVVVESLTMKSLGRDPELPTGWFEVFSWESRPAEVPADRWPTLASVVERLQEQHTRLRTLIESLTEVQLDAPSAVIADRTVRYAILHGLHDEACHSGEVWLLRKLQNI